MVIQNVSVLISQQIDGCDHTKRSVLPIAPLSLDVPVCLSIPNFNHEQCSSPDTTRNSSVQCICGVPGSCKGTYASVRPHLHTCGNYRKTVANVDASDSRCRCICKIITRDLRLVASRLYRMAVTWPGSRASVTLSPSLGADLLGCINHTREKERKH